MGINKLLRANSSAGRLLMLPVLYAIGTARILWNHFPGFFSFVGAKRSHSQLNRFWLQETHARAFHRGDKLSLPLFTGTGAEDTILSNETRSFDSLSSKNNFFMTSFSWKETITIFSIKDLLVFLDFGDESVYFSAPHRLISRSST